MLFGDSITEEAFGEGGWGAHLANHYSRSADVVLRGYSGYNTRWAAMVAARAVVAGAAGGGAAGRRHRLLRRQRRLPPRPRQRAPARPAPGVQGQPPRHLRPPRRRLALRRRHPHHPAARPRRRPCPVYTIALILHQFYWFSRSSNTMQEWITNGAPPRACRYQYGGDCAGLPERTNESAGAYARACVEVAAECGLRVIDIWSKMQRFPGWESSFLR